MEQVNVILLAAGKSERFGKEKPLLKIAGETIIERHLRQLENINVQRCLIVVNQNNRAAVIKSVSIKVNFRIEFILQDGDGAANAICSALKELEFCIPLYIVTVNDIVLDNTYLKMESKANGSDFLIPTVILQKTFIGGCLEVQLENSAILSITERPVGGCQPGQLVNIFIHRIKGYENIKSIFHNLMNGWQYEDTLNKQLESGFTAKFILIEKWVGIKSHSDYEEALLMFCN